MSTGVEESSVARCCALPDIKTSITFLVAAARPLRVTGALVAWSLGYCSSVTAWRTLARKRWPGRESAAAAPQQRSNIRTLACRQPAVHMPLPVRPACRLTV